MMTRRLPSIINLVIALGATLASIALTVLSAAGWLGTAQALSAILGVLSVLLLTTVADRVLVLVGLQQRVDQIYNAVHNPPALRQWSRATPFDDFVLNADKLLIIGLTKAGILTEGPKRLADLVRSGCHVRLAVLYVKTTSLYELVCPITTHTIERFEGDYKQFVRTIKAARQLLTPEQNKRLEVRAYSFAPSAGVILVSRGKSMTAQVYFYPYQTDPAERPTVELYEEGEGSEWLSFFRDHYELLWKNIAETAPDPSYEPDPS
jgi:hypothetical protein